MNSAAFSPNGTRIVTASRDETVREYAQTRSMRRICRIDGVPYVIDFKTSKQVWHEYELQVSAYRVALENGENPIHEKNANGTESNKLVDLSGLKTAILQVGYERANPDAAHRSC